ncbi:SMI1/KNR4 family protein [Amycolatopsis cynarae]|uniref:SMI1/KNR4 family protein n=1 Tax=Amycolatopsis cynarae TaxID=2995223 RepID=A0ABY7B7R4_9PSEU|nr:SMI1/KNR4 family protein [Amycolatopsis sp. HUAS 11-8]WAL66916.1 SMI1/KNR4 family protein [Amycolatopsis sp. HUAS 11-8]
MDAERVLGIGLPPHLREFLAFTNGFEDPDGQWWPAWSCGVIAADNLRVWRSEMLPEDLLAFGDDGASTCFCVQADIDKLEIVRWFWIGQNVETTLLDLPTFWRRWYADPT